MTAHVSEWELLAEEPKFGGYRPVLGRRYRMPSGRHTEWDILWGGQTVAVVAVTDEDQVILVRQFRPGPGRILRELPGGNVAEGEDIAEAAARELLEETGYAPDTIEIVGSTWLAAYATAHRYTAVAKGCRRVADPTPDPDELLEPVLMPMNEFTSFALEGQLTDQDIALRGLVALGVLAVSSAVTGAD